MLERLGLGLRVRFGHVPAFHGVRPCRCSA
jgi:hypothetical protein